MEWRRLAPGEADDEPRAGSRRIAAVAGAPGAGEPTRGFANLTTSWKRFRVVFQRNGALC